MWRYDNETAILALRSLSVGTTTRYEAMTLEDRELLLEEMRERHNGQTKAFWAEWDRRKKRNKPSKTQRR